MLCDRVVEWRLTVNEYGVSSRRDKNVLKLDCGDVAQPVNIIVNFKQVNWMVCELYLNTIVGYFFQKALLLLIVKKQMIKRLVDFHIPDH